MSDVDSLPEFSEDEEVAEITEEIADDGKKKKNEKVKSKFVFVLAIPLLERSRTTSTHRRLLILSLQPFLNYGNHV